MMFLAKYWRVLAVAGGLAALLTLYSCQLDKAEQRGYERATAEMSARVAIANAATAALEQRQRIQSEQAAVAWESKRNELQGQVDDLLRRGVSVRVCKPAASAAPLSGAGTTTAGTDGPAGRALDAVQAGRDVGTELVQLGAECERYRQQLIGLQSWVSEALYQR